jgi:hypothetical protein
MVESACHVAPHLLGDSLANLSSNMDCVSYREPLGVTAGICPFNFPAMVPLWMWPLGKPLPLLRVFCGASNVSFYVFECMKKRFLSDSRTSSLFEYPTRWFVSFFLPLTTKHNKKLVRLGIP